MALTLIDMELEPHEADQTMEKLMLIERYHPLIQQAKERRTQNRGSTNRRRNKARRRR
jgi:hypothetical protein